ncbi:MAG: HAMP domain-containing histidine kinase [Peptococcaceae bacterium]|jgi:signal transduction histidine kinase|nr:HAMP domain-containing histidine kinase [Peptococcaceae bacterium]
MIRKLKIKIIAVVMGALLLVFAAVFTVLNLSMYQASDYQAEDFLRRIAENDGFFLPPRTKPGSTQERNRPKSFYNPEIMRSGRYFYAKVDSGGSVVELNLDMMFDFSRDEALEYVASVLGRGRTKGTAGNFSYLTALKPYGQIAVFAERSIEMGILEHLTRVSLWVAGITGVVLLALVVFLAEWMMNPVKTAFEKQRRFISDASHELKTPLTIISANVDVLRDEIGENTRLAHIRSQSERMSGLIHDLLTLAKTDEDKGKTIKNTFNLSGAVLNTALEFESRAFEEGKAYTYQIKENLAYTGDEKQIRQLVSILIDNAVKHSSVQGKIHVALTEDGGRPRLSVFNTGAGVSDAEKSKIFDRFYRSDESRSRETGGYGLGLSIARAIAAAHRGKITVTGAYGEWVRFDVVL